MPICSTDPPPAVVPEPPAAVAGDSERLVDGVGVPLPWLGAKDRVGGVALQPAIPSRERATPICAWSMSRKPM